MQGPEPLRITSSHIYWVGEAGCRPKPFLFGTTVSLSIINKDSMNGRNRGTQIVGSIGSLTIQEVVRRNCEKDKV